MKILGIKVYQDDIYRGNVLVTEKWIDSFSKLVYHKAKINRVSELENRAYEQFGILKFPKSSEFNFENSELRLEF